MASKFQQITPEGILKLLDDLGLAVSSPAETLNFLNYVDINRVADYLPVAREQHVSESVFLEELQEAYLFDTELKQLLWKWIEPIEVMARSQFVRTVSNLGDEWAYRNKDFLGYGSKTTKN